MRSICLCRWCNSLSSTLLRQRALWTWINSDFTICNLSSLTIMSCTCAIKESFLFKPVLSQHNQYVSIQLADQAASTAEVWLKSNLVSLTSNAETLRTFLFFNATLTMFLLRCTITPSVYVGCFPVQLCPRQIIQPNTLRESVKYASKCRHVY